ncbi:hypothetical protein Pmani_001730 [Petrolisthes manimaculis]|uniref:Uncharacterized protein n=1 Tax=Petrolisthes manimaculis TaxID=1843537 RepID=A0AAE1QK25_9EUCA|nr:hypothetical protein Pmani_001730 [Petrolisthes manimaculis]
MTLIPYSSTEEDTYIKFPASVEHNRSTARMALNINTTEMEAVAILIHRTAIYREGSPLHSTSVLMREPLLKWGGQAA